MPAGSGLPLVLDRVGQGCQEVGPELPIPDLKLWICTWLRAVVLSSPHPHSNTLWSGSAVTMEPLGGKRRGRSGLHALRQPERCQSFHSVLQPPPKVRLEGGFLYPCDSGKTRYTSQLPSTCSAVRGHWQGLGCHGKERF